MHRDGCWTCGKDVCMCLPMKADLVNRPPHYTRGKIEVIDFIEDQQLSYHLGQVIKYVCRAGHKDKSTYTQDLQKAEWYLKRAIGNADTRPISADM